MGSLQLKATIMHHEHFTPDPLKSTLTEALLNWLCAIITGLAIGTLAGLGF